MYGSFGMVKRKLKRHYVLSPFGMLRVIGESSEYNDMVYSDFVRWLNRMTYLERFLRRLGLFALKTSISLSLEVEVPILLKQKISSLLTISPNSSLRSAILLRSTSKIIAQML